MIRKKKKLRDGNEDQFVYYINTLEGVMRATIGDYIIKSVDSESYPCKEHIFKQTHEKVDD